jgi:hypothetical protein
MPFAHMTTSPFTRQVIEAIPPGTVGVYGIVSATAVIYVGKSTDMRERMLAHLYGDNPAILRNSPVSWLGEIRLASEIDAREKQLILEYDPIANKKVG